MFARNNRNLLRAVSMTAFRGKKTTKDVTVPFPAFPTQLFPFSPLKSHDFINEIGNTLMNNPVFPFPPPAMDALSMDFNEHAGSYELVFDVPGVKLSDCHVDLNGHVLSVTVDRQGGGTNSGHGGAKVRKTERYRGHAVRSMELPLDASVEAAAVSATLSHGVLKVEVKKVPHAERKEIAIPISVAE